MIQLTPKKIASCCVLLIIFIVAALYIYKNTEKYTVKERLAQPYQVRKNPYLAAEYYLKKHQQKVTASQNINLLKTLPTTQQTILLLGKRDQLTSVQNTQILNWVQQGGSLIIEAKHSPANSQDSYSDDLLNPLGIKLVKNKTGYTPGLTKLYIEDEKQPIEFRPAYNLELIDQQDRANLWADNNGSIKLLQLPYGKGKITVITSADIWQNYAIDNHDHAWLLSYLTAGHNVTLFYTPVVRVTEHPSFLLAIIKNYPYTLLAIALFILLVLWYNSVRSGPLEPAVEKNRRQLPEQLTAQANFIYKQAGPQQLINLLQKEITYLVKKRLPYFDDLSLSEQHQFISKLTEQPLALIKQLMTPFSHKTTFSHLEFTNTVIALQAIRNRL